MSTLRPRRIVDPLARLAAPRAKGAPDEAYVLLNPATTAVITGAGISTDSGIPDYRSPGSPARNPMTGDAFRSSRDNRARYWARGYVGWAHHDKFEPNAAHYDLAALAPLALITQNADGLHAAAGSGSVIELHGSLHKVVCLSCRHGFHRSWMQGRLRELNPGFLERTQIAPSDIDLNPDGDADVDETAGFVVPDCPGARGL